MAKLSEGIYEKHGTSFRTLTLTDGGCSITVAPERGGMMISMKKGEEEYVWLRDRNFESTERPRCAVPILFPCCGAPKDGVHIFSGKGYPMENHGLADLVAWNVKRADDSAVELELKENGLTRFVYPFPFRLVQKYELNGPKATLTLTVENTGSETMPFSVGYHPYFRISDIENVTFDVHAETAGKAWHSELVPMREAAAFRHTDASEQMINMRGVKSPMILRDSGNGHTVRLDFDEKFTNAVLWEQEAESFIAMEPWNGWPNSVNEPGRHEELAPGQTMTFIWSITID